METDGDFYVLQKGDQSLRGELRQVQNLKLRIWSTGFTQFEELANFPNLAELEIMGYRADTFAPLRSLCALRRLAVFDFPRVTCLEPLMELSSLEELTLETLPGGDASGKYKVVTSFRPLGALKRLRVLKLAGVRAGDDDLSPLAELTGLQVLALGNLFPQEQFALLASRLPQVRCFFTTPFHPLEGYLCGKCGGDKVMLSGSDVPNPKVVCPVCQRKKFESTVARFEEFRQNSARR